MTFPMPLVGELAEPFRHPGALQGRIVSIGGEAQGLLARFARARAVAVFKSSLYLRCGEHWACLGSPGIGRGPLNITCEMLEGVDWREMVSPDDIPVPCEAGFSLGVLNLSTAGAAIWRPRLAPLYEPRRLQRGLAALADDLPADLPSEGLAWFLCGQASAHNGVARAAQQPIEVIVDWLGKDSRGQGLPMAAREAVRSLLGLGPGLTPSGDDFLAGLVVALRAAGCAAEARSLGREIAALAPRCTNEISAAHLSAALRAGLSEDLHNLIRAVLSGDAAAIGACLLRLAGTTHCSSWDALAGAVTAFRCVLAMPDQTQARRLDRDESEADAKVW